MTDKEVTTTPIHPMAVVFDMDGLMLDTERPSVPLWIEVAKTRGWDISEELVFRTIGIDEASCKAVYAGACGPDFPHAEVRDEVHRMLVEQAEREGIPHRPGLISLLDTLAGLGIPLAVATSTARETALWKLRKAGIEERFAVVVCGDEVTRGKPAPDIFLRAVERLGYAPADCAGFEDSPAGLMSLHAAGIRSIFIKDILEPPPETLATVWRRCIDLAEAARLFA
ncbi:MAG: HAD family phosphatase [Treponema sp.]|nr:HAD family phosphatase [Treponema sp.]